MDGIDRDVAEPIVMRNLVRGNPAGHDYPPIQPQCLDLLPYGGIVFSAADDEEPGRRVFTRYLGKGTQKQVDRVTGGAKTAHVQDHRQPFQAKLRT
jgi:hypothetical protein